MIVTDTKPAKSNFIYKYKKSCNSVFKIVARFFHWRRHPDLNRGSEFCRLVPYHLAMSPSIINICKRTKISTKKYKQYEL